MKLNTLRSLVLLIGIMGLLALPAQAQTILTQGTVSTAVTSTTTTTVIVSSATGLAVNTTSLFFPITGEIMSVNSISGTTVGVTRGANGTVPQLLAASAVFIIAQTGSVVGYEPGGACTRGQGIARFSPVISSRSGNIYVCRSSIWQGTNTRLITYNSTAPFSP